MCYALNIMWLDALIMLPLVIRCTHTLVTRGRWVGLFVALVVMFFTQFYLSYMVGLFSFLCFLGMLWVYKPARPWRCVSMFLSATVCAALCCAALLLPTALRLFDNANAAIIHLPVTWEPNVPFSSLLTRAFFGSFDSVVSGQPPLYSGTLVLLLLPVYFFNARIPRRERAVFGGICALLLLSLWLPPLNRAWHGFDDAVWYQFRFSFVLCFLWVWGAHRCFIRMEGIRSWSVLASGALALLYILVLYPNQFHHTEEFARALAPWLVAVWTALLLWLRLVPKARRAVLALCVMLVAAEAGANAHAMMRGIDAENGYTNLSTYTASFTQRAALLAQLPDPLREPYRVESSVSFELNDSLTLGYNGLKIFSSTADRALGYSLARFGLEMHGIVYRHSGSTIATDSLLGIRYLLEYQPPNDYYFDVAEQAGLHVYENTAALPLAFAARAAVLDHRLSPPIIIKSDYGVRHQREDVFALLNGLFSALQDEGEAPLFQPVPIETAEYEMVATAPLLGGGERLHIMSGEYDRPAKRYLAVTEGNGPVYAFWESDYEGGEGQLMLVHSWPPEHRVLQMVKSYDASVPVYVGDYGPDEEIALIFSLQSKELQLRQQALYQLDYDALEALSDEAHGAAMDNLVWHGRRISGTVDVSGERDTLLLMVPYDGGWDATVNGVRVNVERGLDLFCAVPLTQGHNDVRLTYTPPGLLAGLWLSGLGWAGFVVLWLVHRNGKYRSLFGK